ncbi:hypothetical protein SDRG_02218 [Saprolegnia diclina VS20]|uniref:F-box domain-containing protein n=1 Tax=Saprolegnia diclina (strain VS20) TaxID=1156394 RepID=T0R027_SAPDV|nr:hypothetical protein SDRG_02218 [Saprolegnia diclina VS20]EQC40316.1 hypothetical protein SDRG_02218 [Saprolegnia diclina VS20]|eukprot:XP_008606015.1 hypothetical protein SDRG_02218 [Saprolegnia diclina VS20]
MTIDKRATSAPWLLPPIALQILHYLDDADDARAYLQAAPDGSLDDALDALRTLLAKNKLLSLWPMPHIASLDKAYYADPTVVMRALPLFKEITFTSRRAGWTICEGAHAIVLPPTTAVIADVNLEVVGSVREALGKWLPNLAALNIGNELYQDLAAVVADNLSACHGLRTLSLHQEEELDRESFVHTLTAIVATCPQVERISVGSSSYSPVWDCKALLAWLALPTARHLKLDGTDFQDESGFELAMVMLTSSTLETITLSDVPSLTRAVVSPFSPPLPQNLRHLTIIDSMLAQEPGKDDTFNDMYGNGEDDDVVDPPLPFNDGDVAALAAKLSTASRLEGFSLTAPTFCDATPLVNVLVQLPTLNRLFLCDVHLTSFPPLRPLLYLHLVSVTFSDKAIEHLATLLFSTPKLLQLDLSYQYNPLPDGQFRTILRALPQWLSGRSAVCRVNISMAGNACASDMAAALAQTRNSHKVKIMLRTNGVSLDAKKQLVAAIASTSQMALFIDGANRLEEDELKAYGRQLRLQITTRKDHPGWPKQCWFHSPRTLTD